MKTLMDGTRETNILLHEVIFSLYIFDLFDATWLSMRWNDSSNNKMSWDHKLKNSIGSHFIRMSNEHWAWVFELRVSNVKCHQVKTWSECRTHKEKYSIEKHKTCFAVWRRAFLKEFFGPNLFFLCSPVINDDELSSGIGARKDSCFLH